ncbi:23S rRNA (adenine(2503)-C(2))-methyltransferase RlmN [Patescibacteria group bacterium]|nr:23S rRNA (adenine(2503)-C(2))-methyltransferase RlmN [Patescibacteria group bacterium]MBU4367294.1 23S rRNA (adenine(2503)-C(2))-methyltransferase RlmN [Patescibacteria group bacterium]MBU4461989.1 23S rRNA (adenine(2503)-C(2))-methyltransferase RlmN [Patescibacteria group bacterium]MCG2700180.1 23S rRNA (adenine(2503)-C(2))-methyltransferase RlmN [Candidatus Parcubacteria bacterium]
MNITKLKDILKKEPPYRLKQVEKIIFQDLINDWSQAKVLPVGLREELNKKCPLKIDFQASVSKDEKTVKALIILEDGLKIETVLMRHQPRDKTSTPRDKDCRNTVCVSSQAGCPLGCSFCATGKSGFKRNLKASEIVEQILFFARLLKKDSSKVTNVVFMGMGEPFLNYDNVLGAIKVLNNKDGFNLGARHFSISTVGIPEGIKKLSGEKLQINLAISLHASKDELRSKIMPINKKYSIKEVLTVVEEYIKKTKRRVMIEYVMIDGVNDSDECAKDLARLLKKLLYFVNLISYNPTGAFRASSRERIKKFKEILEKSGITVTERYRFGSGIKAACGQLIAREKQYGN